MGTIQGVPSIQASALSVLCSLAFDGANRISIAAQGGIVACITGMEQHQNDIAVQQAGCKLLRLLAFAEENKDLIVSNGGIHAGQ